MKPWCDLLFNSVASLQLGFHSFFSTTFDSLFKLVVWNLKGRKDEEMKQGFSSSNAFL